MRVPDLRPTREQSDHGGSAMLSRKRHTKATSRPEKPAQTGTSEQGKHRSGMLATLTELSRRTLRHLPMSAVLLGESAYP